MTDTEFATRVVLVTGAAQGIGAAIGQAFVHSGATVVLADIDGPGVRDTAASLDCDSHTLDLSERPAVRSMIDGILARHAQIDILVQAAGGVRGQVGGPLEDVTEDEWRALFQANVDGAFWLSQAVAPAMKKQHWGRIINISSGAGLRPSLTGIQAYAAAKHALVGLTKQLSWELGPHGITVNSIAPGLVLSNPSSKAQWDSYSPEVQQQIISATHTGRLGEPEDIAAAVMFFASSSASWISGQILAVDGGHS